MAAQWLSFDDVAIVRRRVIISGLVQGVFFRDTCRRLAEQNGVAGWVRNRFDGTVEAVYEGEEAAVLRMLDWSRRGPRRAVVERVDVSTERPEGLTGFTITI